MKSNMKYIKIYYYTVMYTMCVFFSMCVLSLYFMAYEYAIWSTELKIAHDFNYALWFIQCAFTCNLPL